MTKFEKQLPTALQEKISVFNEKHAHDLQVFGQLADELGLKQMYAKRDNDAALSGPLSKYLKDVTLYLNRKTESLTYRPMRPWEEYAQELKKIATDESRDTKGKETAVKAYVLLVDKLLPVLTKGSNSIMQLCYQLEEIDTQVRQDENAKKKANSESDFQSRIDFERGRQKRER